MGRSLPALLAVAFLAACVGTEPAPTATSGATAASVTTVPPTTTTIRSITTSTPVSTSVPDATVPGDWAEVPVVASAWGVMGWWDGSRWVPAEEDPEVDLRADYRLLTLDEDVVAAAGTVGEYCEVEAGGVVPRPELPWGDPDPFPEPALALSAGWELGPPVELVDGDPQVYVDEVSRFLSSRGLDVPEPDLAQVLVVDLDDDGTDEVIIVAEEIAQAPALFASPGDYAVTLLRSVVDEEVETSVIDEWVLAEVDPDEVPFIVSSRVTAVADLNGDGSAELALASAYYEGSGIQIYAYSASSGPEAVLGAGCGV